MTRSPREPGFSIGRRYRRYLRTGRLRLLPRRSGESAITERLRVPPVRAGVSVPWQRSGIEGEFLASKVVGGPSKQLGVEAAVRVGVRPVGTSRADGAPRCRAKAGSHRPSGSRPSSQMLNAPVMSDSTAATVAATASSMCTNDQRPAPVPSTGYWPARSCAATSPSGWNQVPVRRRTRSGATPDSRAVRAQRALLDGGQRANSSGHHRRAMRNPRLTLVRQPISRPVVVAARLCAVPAGARSDRGCVKTLSPPTVPHSPSRGQSRGASPRECSCVATRWSCSTTTSGRASKARGRRWASRSGTSATSG